jgi:hypothetical protein
MYLYLFADGTIRQVHDNITISDVLAIKEGLLRVFTIHNNKFVRIVVDEEKLCVIPVQESDVIQNKEGRLHHI